MKKGELLTKSIELITGDREDDYGDITKNFSDIAALWSVVLGMDVIPWQVAACMSQVKLARAIKTPEHLDSWADMGGYVGIGAELATEPIVQLEPESPPRFEVDGLVEEWRDYFDFPIGGSVWQPNCANYWTKIGPDVWLNGRSDVSACVSVTWTTEDVYDACPRRRIRSLPGVVR